MTGIPESIQSQVVSAIASVVGKKSAVLHEPSFTGSEWLYVKECLDSTFVSSVGKFVDQFELDLAKFTGAKHAIAVVNGTAALHLTLKLAGVQLNDEVLIPTLSFVATANAVAYCGATPHFVDSESTALGIDAEKLRDYLRRTTEYRAGQCVNVVTGRVIRALVPMHTFGHPVDMEKLLAIASDYHITLIEDAAESLGSYYYGVHTGTIGLMGALSFNGNKIITTGGGGAILTNDSALAKRAKYLSTTAKVPHSWKYFHDEIGFNYRMPNLNAALGCAQMEKLPSMLASKRKLANLYEVAFSSIPGISLLKEPRGCMSNYWLQTILLDKKLYSLRDTLLEATNSAGYMSRPIWNPLHELPPYSMTPRMDLLGAESLATRLINIPSSSGLVGAGNG